MSIKQFTLVEQSYLISIPLKLLPCRVLYIRVPTSSISQVMLGVNLSD